MIDALPVAPAPTNSPAEFDVNMFAFLAAMAPFRLQANSTATDMQNNADVAAALLLSMALPQYAGTSTTSLAIGTGAKSFVTQAGKAWTVGQEVVASNGGAYMKGTVTGYTGTALDVNVTRISGSGTLASWTIGLSYKALGLAPRAQRVDVATVAGTVDLTANAPDSDDVQFTGALAVTGFTVAAGRVIRGRAAAGMTLVNGANLITQTGADIVCVAGATFMLRAIAANQVEVLNFVSPSTSPTVQGLFKNLLASATGSNANVSVSADEIVLESATNDYVTLRNVALTIAGTSVGANGIDAGSLATGTWYSAWVIWNPTTATKAGLLSLSATAPTLPSGYTHKARVGWIRTDGTANKYPLAFRQVGRKVRYVVAGNVTGLPVVDGGVARGDTAAPTYVAASVTSVVPTTAPVIALMLSQKGQSCQSMCAPNGSYGSYASLTNPAPMQNGVASTVIISSSTNYDMILESTNVYVAWQATSAYLYCTGWEDNL